MTQKQLPGATLLRLAALMLTEVDIKRCIEPAVADLQHEEHDGRGGGRWARLRNTLLILWMLVLLWCRERSRQASRTQWLGLVPAVLATLLGLLLFEARADNVVLQLAWLGLGLLLSFFAATSPRQTLRRIAVALASGAVVVLFGTAWFGTSTMNATRWLAIGPLQVQTSTLLLPLVILAVSQKLVDGSLGRALVLGVAAQLALILQRDGVSSLALAVAAIVVVFGVRVASGWRAYGISSVFAASAGIALLRDPVLGEHPVNPSRPLAIAAALVLLMVPVYPAVCAFRSEDRATRAIGFAFSAALATLVTASALGLSSPLLLTYGGSTVVGCLISLAFVLAFERQGPIGAKNSGATAEGSSEV
jgi:cell division protein FtsW (lipid II flippase)